MRESKKTDHGRSQPPSLRAPLSLLGRAAELPCRPPSSRGIWCLIRRRRICCCCPPYGRGKGSDDPAFNITVCTQHFSEISMSPCSIRQTVMRRILFFSCRRRQPWPRGVVQGASACWLVQILGAGALLIRDKKLPSSPHQRNIGLQKKSTPVSWAAPSLKSADKCSKGRPQLSKQR